MGAAGASRWSARPHGARQSEERSPGQTIFGEHPAPRQSLGESHSGSDRRLGFDMPDSTWLYGISVIGFKSTGVEVAARTPVPRRIQRLRRSELIDEDESVLGSDLNLRPDPLRLVGFLHLMHVSMVYGSF